MRFLGRVLIVGLAGLVLASCERAVQLPRKPPVYSERGAPPTTTTALGQRIFSVIGSDYDEMRKTISVQSDDNALKSNGRHMLSPYGVMIGVTWQSWVFRTSFEQGTGFNGWLGEPMTEAELFSLLGLDRNDWSSGPPEFKPARPYQKGTLYKWKKYRIFTEEDPQKLYSFTIWYEHQEFKVPL